VIEIGERCVVNTESQNSQSRLFVFGFNWEFIERRLAIRPTRLQPGTLERIQIISDCAHQVRPDIFDEIVRIGREPTLLHYSRPSERQIEVVYEARVPALLNQIANEVSLNHLVVLTRDALVNPADRYIDFSYSEFLTRRRTENTPAVVVLVDICNEAFRVTNTRPDQIVKCVWASHRPDIFGAFVRIPDTQRIPATNRQLGRDFSDPPRWPLHPDLEKWAEEWKPYPENRTEITFNIPRSEVAASVWPSGNQEFNNDFYERLKQFIRARDPWYETLMDCGINLKMGRDASEMIFYFRVIYIRNLSLIPAFEIPPPPPGRYELEIPLPRKGRGNVL